VFKTKLRLNTIHDNEWTKKKKMFSHSIHVQRLIDVINDEKRHMVVIEYIQQLYSSRLWYTIGNYFNTNEIYSKYFKRYKRLTYFRHDCSTKTE